MVYVYTHAGLQLLSERSLYQHSKCQVTESALHRQGEEGLEFSKTFVKDEQRQEESKGISSCVFIFHNETHLSV